MREFNSSNFDLSVDSESDVVADRVLSTMLEGSEAFAVDEDLDRELLVDDGQIESNVFLEWRGSFTLFIVPESIAVGVANDLK